jgi:methenyltetrahydromethanopterin cyclohydrolase
MGRVNDVIRYCGSTYYIVDFYDDEQLRDLVKRVPPTDNEFFRDFLRKPKTFTMLTLVPSPQPPSR